MKNIIYISVFVLTCLLSSCNDFLVENPKTNISQNVYNSESMALASLNGCYALQAAYDGYSFNYFHVVTSTSVIGLSTKANDIDLSKLNILTTNTNVEKTYIGQYQVIGSANDILEGMKTSEIKSEDVKNKINGEAHFIRAVSYFNLVRLFGKLPLITKPVTSYQEAQAPRSEVADVYKLIISDFNNAFNLLPEPGQQEEGRPHKYAAKAMLAKVYVTMAGYDDNSSYWTEAYNEAMEVYKDGKYSLVAPFPKLFGASNKNTVESIFEIQMSANQNGARTTETTLPAGHPSIPYAPTSVNSWGKTRPTQLAYELISPDDPRKIHTFFDTVYVNKNDGKAIAMYPTTQAEAKKNKWQWKGTSGDSDYAAWNKYIDKELTTYSSCNFLYYRYGDLLLLLAEAANEIGKTDEALLYVNQILDRARDVNGNGNFESTEVYPAAAEASQYDTKEKLRAFILNERLVELSGECDAWFTIRRKGPEFLKEMMVKHNDTMRRPLNKVMYEYDTSDNSVMRNLLLPFPASEINRNENISQNDQNPGY